MSDKPIPEDDEDGSEGTRHFEAGYNQGVREVLSEMLPIDRDRLCLKFPAWRIALSTPRAPR